jgi:hypothetical protein
VKQERLRLLGALILTVLVSSFAAKPAAAQAKPVPGKLTGVVRDAAGTPQMGATVELISETVGVTAARNLLTNTEGAFRGDKLSPGFYTLRVTLAGFLPTLEKHIRVTSNLTTVVRVELESMFASLDQLRRAPASTTVQGDDWKWVLRSASAVRPVLEWVDDGTVAVSNVSFEAPHPLPRMRMEFTDGARRPTSASSVASAPATAVAYDQKLVGMNRMIIAGQVSYDTDTPAGGIATVWLPSGTLGAGPHTALVLREAKLGPVGPNFRGVRFDQGGAIVLSDRVQIQYGGEYVLVGLGAAASAIRPRAQLNVRINDDWTTSFIFASMPTGPGPLEGNEGQPGTDLAAALDELDAFPALLWRQSHPVLQSGLHEEVSAEKKLGTRGRFQIAGFHDDNSHVAVFGRGSDLPAADFFQDYLSTGFAYDGGSSSSWGGRIAYREKLGNDLELTAIYSYGGALAPFEETEEALRDALRTQQHHAIGTGISTKVPKLGTRVQVGYKWVFGTTVSSVDPYGDSIFQTDPYVHLVVRQPLPKFTLGRWEAIAECNNLLAQGYVSTNTRDGHIVLVPAFRTFRGGLSVQF